MKKCIRMRINVLKIVNLGRLIVGFNCRFYRCKLGFRAPLSCPHKSKCPTIKM